VGCSNGREQVSCGDGREQAIYVDRETERGGEGSEKVEMLSNEVRGAGGGAGRWVGGNCRQTSAMLQGRGMPPVGLFCSLVGLFCYLLRPFLGFLTEMGVAAWETSCTLC
jgi:hypothetical protein